MLFYHMPFFYRKAYVSVSKDKLAPILAFKKVKVEELGFHEEKAGFYKVNAEFDKKKENVFVLDEERVQNLGKIVKYLES